MAVRTISFLFSAVCVCATGALGLLASVVQAHPLQALSRPDAMQQLHQRAPVVSLKRVDQGKITLSK